MPAPDVTPLPPAPLRSQSPSTFTTTAEAFVAALPGLVADINEFGDYLDGLGLDPEDIPTAASAAEIWAGAVDDKFITPDALFDAAAFVVLADGATITPNFGAGLNFKVTLGGNRTLANPTNAKIGQSGVIKVVQDGTGTRTLSYGNLWRFPGGAAAGGVLSTAAGSIDLIAYVVDDGGLILATLSKAFAA